MQSQDDVFDQVRVKEDGWFTVAAGGHAHQVADCGLLGSGGTGGGDDAGTDITVSNAASSTDDQPNGPPGAAIGAVLGGSVEVGDDTGYVTRGDLSGDSELSESTMKALTATVVRAGVQPVVPVASLGTTSPHPPAVSSALLACAYEEYATVCARHAHEPPLDANRVATETLPPLRDRAGMVGNGGMVEDDEHLAALLRHPHAPELLTTMFNIADANAHGRALYIISTMIGLACFDPSFLARFLMYESGTNGDRA